MTTEDADWRERCRSLRRVTRQPNLPRRGTDATGFEDRHPTCLVRSQFMNERIRQAATLIPAFAALGIAVLYAVGAIVKGGQLRHAGLNVRDTLPLVPCSNCWRSASALSLPRSSSS